MRGAWIALLALACAASSEPFAPSLASTTRVDSLAVTPDTLALAYMDEARITATCYNQNANPVKCRGGVTWTVRDTTKIRPILTKAESVYVQARDTGVTYVVARDVSGRGIDSSKVRGTSTAPAPITPTPPPLVVLASLEISPSTASLLLTAPQQFAAVAKNNLGGTMSPAPTISWSATGGSIDGDGLYTAGSTPGTYRAIAATGGFADTAVITIAAPTAVVVAAEAGINGNTGFNTAAAYVTQVNSKATDLGLTLVRMGMDGVSGSTTASGFNWTTRDAVVSSHRAAGIGMHSVLSFRSHVAHGASQAEWVANWRHFVGGVMRHYAGQIRYYIIDNEPELNGFTDAALAVTFTKAAYDSAAVIDPAIRIETPPTGSAGASFLQAMIQAGITRYAHVVGVHSYGGQINDTHAQGLRKPWEWMAASGYPQIAVACSECSTSSGWAPAGVDARAWQARWFRQAAIAFRRYGYDNVLLYSFRSTAGTGFDIASWNGTTLTGNEPTYTAVQDAWAGIASLSNAGFESANDRELEWAVVFNTDQATPAEWSAVSFVTGDGANAHAGTGYLRFTSSAKVRRLVAATAGVPITVTAWAKLTSGTATLKVQGYDHTNGDLESSQATSTTGAWVQRTVTVTPTNPWIVIDLEGTGAMTWDDVAVTP